MNCSVFSHIDTLVLSGGSLKGYAYIGVFKKLEELRLTSQITTVATCSIGSIFGLMFILGYSHHEMENLANRIDSKTLYKCDIRSIILDYGFCDFSRMRKLLSELLMTKGLRSNVSFKDLYQYSNKTFIVNATCINNQSTEYFYHNTHPEMEVLLAIQMTTAVPFMFTRVKYDGKYYVDGGILDNLPLPFFKDKVRVLSICLIETLSHNYIDSDIDFCQYLNLLINCVFNSYNLLREKVYYPDNLIVKISSSVNLLTLSLTGEEISQLIVTGYNQTGYYLCLWSKKHNTNGINKKVKICLKIKSKI